MIGCSGSHKDSNPNDSALCARTATSIDRLESVIFTPIFMLPSMLYGCLYRVKRLLQHNESIGFYFVVARTHPLSRRARVLTGGGGSVRLTQCTDASRLSPSNHRSPVSSPGRREK